MRITLKKFAAAVLVVALAVGSAGCASDNPNLPPTDWTPMVRAVDQALTNYAAAKFPNPTPDQQLVLSLKAIAVETIIIAMQRAGAPPAVLAEVRKKADTAYGTAADEVADIVEAAPELAAPQ